MNHQRTIALWRSKTVLRFLIVIFLAAASPDSAFSAPDNVAKLESPHFHLQLPADCRRLGEQVLKIAESARQFVMAKLPKAVEERIGLAWCATESDFYSHLGERRGHLLAVAFPLMRRVYLNGEQLQRLDRGRLHQALVHELVHVYVGRLIREPVPLWLHEGLAMIVAGEWDLADSTLLAADSLFGALLPAEQLAQSFPSAPSSQQRAYRQSYSMTAFLLHLRYPTSGLQGLVADLAETNGPSPIRSLLADPRWMVQFDRQWRREWVRPGRITLILTSSGTFWALVAGLLIAAYWRRRRTRTQREARWAWEEEFEYHDDEFDD